MEIRQEIAGLLSRVKEQKPLVHHLTNYVTVNDCANMVLAVGGSPVMADEAAEVAEMTALAAALVLNIGTLNSRVIESMLLAGQKANELGIPVILDPVGVGATGLRKATAERIMQNTRVAVVRGNMAEIKTLAGIQAQLKGVDSLDTTAGAEDVAVKLAQRLQCVVAVTGARDVISDGQRVCLIDNGHPLLAQVTGTGCMCTSLVGAYAGVTKDYYLSAVAGVTTMGLAGERAAAGLAAGEGTGTFRVRLFDHISSLTAKDLREGGKVHETRSRL